MKTKYYTFEGMIELPEDMDIEKALDEIDKLGIYLLGCFKEFNEEDGTEMSLGSTKIDSADSKEILSELLSEPSEMEIEEAKRIWERFNVAPKIQIRSKRSNLISSMNKTDIKQTNGQSSKAANGLSSLSLSHTNDVQKGASND